VRYDAATRRVYVACGDDQTGAIAIIDATTNRRLDEEYKLGSQPESFQLETSGPNIYVNLPGLKQIAVINRATKTVTRWSLTWRATSRWRLTKPITGSSSAHTSRRAWPYSIRPRAG
jgi:DNA-binding beta-propeller fold protein YncE